MSKRSRISRSSSAARQPIRSARGVIGAPLSPQFRVLRIRIDRGDRDIATGMPVISGTGPVGRVDKVYGDYADVTLMSDPSSSIEVLIPRTGGRGMLTGLGRPDSYACTIGWLEKQINPTSKVEVGDEIVTSGLGASFPPGLVVGKISKIARDDGMFQRVEVEPLGRRVARARRRGVARATATAGSRREDQEAQRVGIRREAAVIRFLVVLVIAFVVIMLADRARKRRRETRL